MHLYGKDWFNMNKTEYSRDALNERYCDVCRVDKRKLEQLLKSGSVDMCGTVLSVFLEETGFFEIKSFLMKLYVAMDIYVFVCTFAKELGISNADFARKYGSIDDIAAKITKPDGGENFFCEMLEQCIRWRIQNLNESANTTINRTLEYIEDKYCDEDISLKSVAEYVNLSPAYFSAWFKKETGINFSDYITDKRIEKAKELLCGTSKLISEIAYEVGFSDYRYFGQIFKKFTGKTPREFQAGSRRIG